MRSKYRGQFDPAARYRPQDIVNRDGRFLVMNRTGIFKPLSKLKPDPADRGEPGRDGANGVDGRDGINGLDAQGFTLRGKWTRGKVYQPLDVVTHNGSSWSAVEQNKREPTLKAKAWQLLAAKGADGGKGDQGLTGPRGPGRRADSTSTETHLLTFPAYIGQVVTASGLASMADPYAIGVAVSSAEYITEGSVTIPGLIPGAKYYVDEFTPGAISSIAPSNGYVVVIGRAIDENNLDIEIDSPIKL